MARVKRGTTTHARHKKVLEQSKGFVGRSSTSYRIALERLEKSLQYAYRDRRVKKRGARARPELQHVYRRPEQGRDRNRPQGAGRFGL